MVQASSRPGDLCLDPFAGSGTLGAVAAKLDRRFLLMDESPDAVRVMRERLAPWAPAVQAAAERGDQNAASASPSAVAGGAST
jgi:DNA modification methylase